MRTMRSLLVTALIGLFLSSFIAVSPARAQASESCTFANPVRDGRRLEDSIISGMHAVGDGALPGLDGVGSIYSMFPGVLYAGTEPNPSGLVTTYVRIEGVGSCEGWVMDVFHLAFAQGLESKVGTIVDESTLLGVESMNGVEKRFRAHWHLSVGQRVSQPQGFDSQMVTDAIGPVYWVNPLDLVGETTVAEVSQRVVSRSSNWSGIILIVGAAVLLLASGVFVVKNPRSALRGMRAAGRAAGWVFDKTTRGLYWLHVVAIEIPFGNGKFFRAAIFAGLWTGLCLVIPLTGLALLSVITGGDRVEAVRLSFPVKTSPSGQISVIFTPEIQAWAPKIIEWSGAFDLDPNLVSTIMQIESCGDAYAVSPSGAQGLFQVMPFHFGVGEDHLDPDTNASRSLSFLRQTIAAYPGDIGRAIAAYNGGIAGVSRDSSLWAAETQKYWYWGTGIFADANSGANSSARLAEWLAVDAGRLCKSTRK